MGAALSVTAANIITKVLYELRDPSGTNYNKDGAYAELLGYINRCLEWLYEILVGVESELVRTGSGTITTVAGTQSYALSSNSMGDLWFPHRVWISTYQPMDQCEEADIYDAISANEGGQTSRAQPDEYCIIGDYLWFKDVPDAAYTVNVRYFPNFVPLSATTSAMPYKNLFNNEVIEGVKILAKNRNEMSVSIDASLKDIFYQKAMKIVHKRDKRDVRFTL